MFKLSSAANFRRSLAGTCMILAPVVIFVSTVASTSMKFPADPEARMNEMAADPGRSALIGMTFAFSQLLFIPVVLGIVHLVKDKGVVLAHIGALLAGLGLFGHAVYSGAQFVAIEIAKSGSVDVFERFQKSTLLNPFTAFGFLGFLLGFILLSLALWRGGVVPGWFPVVFIVSLILEFFASGFFPPAAIVAGVVFVGVLGWLGVKVLRMSDSEWEAGQSAET